MGIVSKILDIGKGTGNYLCEAYRISLDPAKPIPRTNTHPRMPAHPYSLGEYLRMFPYRHYWRFLPWIRNLCYAVALTYYIKCTVLTPSRKAKAEMSSENLHHTEASKFYGRTQRQEDVKYFKENDPKAALRPKWFAHDFSQFSFSYYPKGYGSEH